MMTKSFRGTSVMEKMYDDLHKHIERFRNQRIHIKRKDLENLLEIKNRYKKLQNGWQKLNRIEIEKLCQHKIQQAMIHIF